MAPPLKMGMPVHNNGLLHGRLEKHCLERTSLSTMTYEDYSDWC